MQLLSRRSFLQLPAALWAAEPGLRFPAKARERLCVASYPFRAFMETPANRSRSAAQPLMDLKAFAAMVRERFRLRRIEPLYSHFASTEPAYLGGLREAFEKQGVSVVNIPVSVGTSLYDPDPARRQAAVEQARRWVDAASLVGAPSIRVHVQGIKDVAPDVARTVECLRVIADYGAGHNILIDLENDSLISEDAFFLVRVIDQAAHPWLHALPDFGNSLLSGNEAFAYDALSLMFRHAYNICHVKDSEVESGKVFRVDMARSFAIAEASGFRGYFSMEWEGQGGPYEGTQKLIDDCLRYLR